MVGAASYQVWAACGLLATSLLLMVVELVIMLLFVLPHVNRCNVNTMCQTCHWERSGKYSESTCSSSFAEMMMMIPYTLGEPGR